MLTFFPLLILSLNIFLAESEDRLVPSVEFKSDQSEIEFGKSATEPKSGDFNSDNSGDAGYYDDEDQAYETTEKESFPNDVFLTLRNITSETSFRGLENRNDVIETTTISKDTIENSTTAAGAVNLRTLRDARPRIDEPEDNSVQLFAPQRHTKIDTAELSDCALQGEWKPMPGVESSHLGVASAEIVLQEPDELQPVGSNTVQQYDVDVPEESDHLQVVQTNFDLNQHFKRRPVVDGSGVNFLSPPPMPHILIGRKPQRNHKPKHKSKKPEKSHHQVQDHGFDSVGSSSFVSNLPHQHLSQPEDPSSSFTCGKNHDHGTHYHTASFQVADDDDSAQQYQAEATVYIPQRKLPYNPPLRELSASNRAGNHRYSRPGNSRLQDKQISDQIEEPNRHRFYHEITHVTKYPSGTHGPVQFSFGHHEESPTSYAEVDLGDSDEVVRELEQLSNKFQYDLDHENYAEPPSSQEHVVNNIDEGKLQQYHTTQPYHTGIDHSHPIHRPVFHHSGHNLVNVNGYGSPPKHENNRLKYVAEHLQHDDPPEYQDFVAGFEYKVPHGPPAFYQQEPGGGQFSLPVSVPDVHPPKHDKPKKHKPPKRKHPTKQYEVHENSGEKQTPLSEIFPPQKMPKQFNNRMPNFAVNVPKKPPPVPPKPSKPTKHENLYAGGVDYDSVLYTPVRNKQIKKFRPSNSKRKVKPQGRLRRRPVTDSSIKLSTPIIRVVEVSS